MSPHWSRRCAQVLQAYIHYILSTSPPDFAIGFFIRRQLVSSLDSLPLYIGAQLLIIVSPAAFLAFNYVLYGRLIRIFAGHQPGYSLIRPQLVTRVFVISDVATFFMQVRNDNLFTYICSTLTVNTFIGRRWWFASSEINA